MFTGSVVQDITADGWILNKLPEKLSYAGPVQSIGNQIGVIISFSVFLMIEQFVTFNQWNIIMISALLVTNLVIVFAVSEGKSDENYNTFKVAKLIIRKVLTLHHFRYLAVILPIIFLAAATIFNGKLFYIQLQGRDHRPKTIFHILLRSVLIREKEHNFSRDKIGEIELYMSPL